MSNTKTVLYYGKVLEVPQGAKYIHTDSDGDVYWSNKELKTLDYTFDTFGLDVEYDYITHFNHTEMSTINWLLSQKRISDLPSVSSGLAPEPEQKAHTHADLMLKYSQIAQYSDKPWEKLQFKGFDGTWLNCTHQPQFKPERQYRLKPQPICIKEGQLWRSTIWSVLIKVHSVKHPELQNGSIVVTQRINSEFTLYSELTKTELQEHFTLVK